MVRRLLSVLLTAALVVSVAIPAFAQGGSSSQIIGTVVDASGGTIPGATIEAKNTGTGTILTAVSTSTGSFTIPAVPTGTYSVTVSLQGFKTAVLNGVVVTGAQPASITAKLEVGGVSEQVVVEGASTIVQTQATSVTQTINTKQIESLPLTSRNVIDFLAFMPGVNVASSTRNANVNGLPGSAVNITLDGVNIQDNTNKSTDGFFTIVQPRMDAIEEVSITGAAAGATDGQGAITVKFITRSGTNSYTGSLYNYFRSDKLNQNTWFNKRDGVAIAKLKQNQTGGRLGGPIWIPGIYKGNNKAFFFTNIENFNQPSDVTRRRTILNPLAQAGTFRYTVNGATREVNLLTLAAANGQLASMDPTIVKLLSEIRSAASSTGTITDQTDPLYQDFNYNVPTIQNNWFPTLRIDLNVTKNHRFSVVYNHDVFKSDPDTLNNAESFFPGFPNYGSQTSQRISVTNTLRSTFGRNIVNEAKFAIQGSPVEFFTEQFDATRWNGTVANQKGFQLGISAAGITNAGTGPNAQSRNAKVFLYEDTLNWVKGAHSVAAGVSVSNFHVWLKNQTTVPSITFGIQTNDPAAAMFNTTNFAGASTANLNAARALYAVLTGRVTQITGNARIDEGTGNYVYQGPAIQRGSMIDSGFYIQDTWRLRPNLTINAGLRYELQGPFSSANSLYSYATEADAFGVSGLSSGCDPDEPTAATCNLFKPGTLPGSKPQFQQLVKGSKAYGTDYNNIAPSIGVNWTPSSDNSFLKAIMGEQGQFAIRGGWTRAYTRNGLGDYTGVFNANPGIRITANKSEGLGNLGSNLVLLRNDAQLTAASFPATPTYPLTGVVTDSINVFAQNLKVPFADTYTAGIQRGLTKNTAIEVRYVGTRSRDSIVNYNLNELNINENGFLNEFKLAQANLQANIAAGRGATFRYFGAGTGTSPLPIYQAYFSGVTAANASNAALYTSANYTSTNFINSLAKYNPNPFTAANNLAVNSNTSTPAMRANAVAAGLPVNFFVANPDYLGGANVTGNGGFTKFNSIQTEIRRRLANGFQFQANYVYGKGYQSSRYSFRVPRKSTQLTGGSGDVTHAIKGNLVLDLPFGKGRRFLGSAGPVLDRIVGGWQVNVNVRIQSGRLVDLGNVRMVGFNEDDLKKMFKLRHDSTSGTDRIYMLPQTIIDESVKAFSVSATSATGYGAAGAPSGQYFAPANGPDCIESIANGYGDCGTRSLVVRGPWLKETDLSIVKSVNLWSRIRAEFRAEALNVFNTVNFVPVGGVGSTTVGGYEVSGLTGTNAARVVQLVSRISW